MLGAFSHIRPVALTYSVTSASLPTGVAARKRWVKYRCEKKQGAGMAVLRTRATVWRVRRQGMVGEA